MDRIPTNTIYKERQFFISKLKSNPIFLFRHVGSFTWIIWNRLQAKFLTQLRGRHRGQKKRPHWLNHINKFCQSESIPFHDLLKQIPERKLPSAVHSQSVMIHNSPTHSEDPEDYLFLNRWGNLINDVLTMKNNVNSAQELPTYIKKWLNEPPQKNDLAWETYSTCERVANLLTWISFIPIDKRSEVVPTTIPEFLQVSIEWIFAHLEFYAKQTGNHILNNARALIMGGAVVKNETAMQTGILILQQMLPILIQPDGFLRERSSHYQLIVLTWLLDAFTFAQNSKTFSATEIAFLQDTIKRMCNAASIFCDHLGYLQAYIGDISPDMTPLNTARRLKICYPDYWPLPSKINQSINDDWHLLVCERNKVLLNCPRGQYPKQFPSHAHGDITSFVWVFNDTPILIDTGRSRYTKDPISSLQKSAVGHNVALVNNLAPLCESFVLNGNWWPLPYAAASITVETNKNAITIEHNGFKRATPVKKHTRKIDLFADAIQVCDHFTGAGQVYITLLWQLHPAFTLFNNDTLTVSNGDLFLTIDHSQMLSSPEIELFHSNPKIGWYSSQYGVSKANPVLSLHWIANLPFESKINFRIKSCAV